MSKTFLATALLAAGLTLTSCGTQGNALAGSLLQSALGGNNSTATATAVNTGSALLSNILSGVLSGGTVEQKDIVGTWVYTGSDAVFESENLLAQAGGLVAASSIEQKADSYLSKYGIKKGVSTFTFKSDNTFTATLNGKTISGTYALDSKNKMLRLSAMAGLLNLTPYVARSTNGISILFEADKILSLAGTASSLLGQSNAQLSLLNNLLGNYNGLRLGLQLQRKG